MKIQIIGITLLAVSSFALFQNCGKNKDILGSALGSKLSLSSTGAICQTVISNGRNPIIMDRLVNETPRMSPFEEAGHKVLIQESMIEQGTKLSMTVDQDCIKNRSQAQTLSAQMKSDEKSMHDVLPKSGIWNLRYEAPQSMTKDQLETLAEADSCIIGVNVEQVLTTNAAPTDPQYAQQAFHNSLSAAGAWDIFYNTDNGISEPVLIGIIDTGMDLNHPDLRPQIWTNPNETAGNGTDDDGNGMVDDINGWDFVSNVNSGPLGTDEIHSTHVAGLAAARAGYAGDPQPPVGVAGINGRHARIMALDVFQGNGAATATIANAIRYAASKRAAVINMSLGAAAAPSADIVMAIDFALSQGTFVVVAAGNDACAMVAEGTAPSNTCTRGGNAIPNIGSPASIVRQGMLTVAALHETTNALCGFSNRNAPNSVAVQIGAPGCGSIAGTFRNPPATGLLSTFPNNTYNRISGTSMASPVVAGAAALAHGLYRARRGNSPSPALLEEIMLAGSIEDAGLTASVTQGKRLNLLNLANYIVATYPELPDDGGGGPINPCP